MTIEYTIIETTQEVYIAIYKQHREQLQVFESFTDVEGGMFGNAPTIDTRWGFRGGYFPIIVSIATKEDRHQKDWDYKYYLTIPKNLNND
jgi:hypothetical protein